MITEIKVGDTVRINKEVDDKAHSGKIGKIVLIRPNDLYPYTIEFEEGRVNYKMGEFEVLSSGQLNLIEAMENAKDGDVLQNTKGDKFHIRDGKLFLDILYKHEAIVTKELLGGLFTILPQDRLNSYIAKMVACEIADKNYIEIICKDAYNLAIQDVLATNLTKETIEGMIRI